MTELEREADRVLSAILDQSDREKGLDVLLSFARNVAESARRAVIQAGNQVLSGYDLSVVHMRDQFAMARRSGAGEVLRAQEGCTLG